MKEVISACTNQKKAGVAILVSVKADVRANKVFWGKKDSIMINRSILQEDTTIINVFTSNKRVSKYVKKKKINCKENYMDPLL